ncbi:heavy metal translocating P-type ATPase [Pseudarthrobacter sp. J75]|uniref:heavy metal translocating P-type ATPase n=1 Tax=unclassified Pseudarthrobacter TaxID=2647000 RepID=UPI002E815A76|nr:MULTISPECIES: heavy metal translocating P-type ATPase [unclassified Pseudarthrobacter]MEE2523616.1 heavy metal translocating P-type ATPase [Pseudarthrobacter sp. J47]MEE2530006.1 heavy metal translocating P-type ATPase [Pseudarthrobacter sp. J75]MEE2570584.1 heavy metal translocating P-type ATPase [Pseudarthrobacter sp. J64]
MRNDELLQQAGSRVIELDIEGMTCASCVNRVERKLSKLDGVQASVNLPLESATVTVPDGVTDQQIVDTVRATGYKAKLRATGTVAQQPSPPMAEAPSEGGFGDVRQHASKVGPRRQGSLPELARGGGRRGGTSEHAEHIAEAAGHSPAAATLKPRLIVAAVLTVPVFAISMVPALQFPQWGWVAAVLALPVVSWAAWPFHRAAAINARHFASTMDTLVSIGVIAAYVFSAWQLFADPQLTAHAGPEAMAGMEEAGLYFEVAAVVTTFLLLGRYLEANAKHRAGNALRALLDLGAKDATVLEGGAERRIPADRLQVDDVIVVRPGERIATDGVVIEGSSAVDASLVTGESMPVEVSPGSGVTGATINTSGRLLVRATRVGSETTLAHMGRLVSQAQSGKAPIARLADRISSVFVPVVLVIAALTFGIWLLVAGPAISSVELQQAFTAAVAVLVIACPCALGLATPVGLLTGTGRGAQLGILIKGPQVLEDTRTVDTIVLDKTGTVTSGELSVDSVHAFGTHSEAEVLRLGGAVEAASEHPIARAIAAAALSAAAVPTRVPASMARETASEADDAGRLPDVDHFRSAAGGGVGGEVEGHAVLAGRSSWLEENGVRIGTAEAGALQEAEAGGSTAIWVAVDGAPAGIIALRDTIKPGSAEAISRLRGLGLRPLLLTGDNAEVAAQVAAAVGIDPEDVHAGVLPEGKVEVVRKLQGSGATVAMAGDGVNDAAALAQADLGIAMGSGTDVAIEAADLTVMGNDLGQVVQAIELSRRTLSTIKTNLFWAFFYNAVGIPVAALGLLNPMIAGAAMAASSVLVVANSLRLRRFGKQGR